METKSFFSADGITSTSANYYANLAKERTRTIYSKINSVRFYSEFISVIGESKENLVSTGNTSTVLNAIEDDIKAIGQLNALIAFFREAIKEKERLTDEARKYKDNEGLNALLKKYGTMIMPVKGEYLTEENIISKWSIGEQEKYLSLQAMASALGKAIHEDGTISKARQDLQEKTVNPCKVVANGRDTIIYNYTPSVSVEEVDSLYFKLQAQHREVQAELNGIKHKIETELANNRKEVDEDYAKRWNEYNSTLNLFEGEKKALDAAESVERNKRLADVANLKIAIPDRLKDIFMELKTAA